jgi:hypothetical protein
VAERVTPSAQKDDAVKQAHYTNARLKPDGSRWGFSVTPVTVFSMTEVLDRAGGAEALSPFLDHKETAQWRHQITT